MGLSGCSGVVKYLLVLINLIFWILGILGVALAAWMISDPTFYLSMTQDESKYYVGLYVFLALGGALVVLALLGCCGAVRESSCLLVTFFCVLLVGVVGEAAAVWWAAAHGGLHAQVRATVEATVRLDYDGTDTRTAAFDAIQKGLECCGASGPLDWSGSQYSRRSMSEQSGGVTLAAGGPASDWFLAPPSCCRRPESPDCEDARKQQLTAPVSPALFPQGCSEKVIEAIDSHMNILMGAGIFIVVMQVLGLIFSVCLCAAVNRSDRYKA